MVSYSRAALIGSGFTYQGQLSDNAAPANGNFDFRFALYDSLTNGNPAGTVLTNSGVLVESGFFATTLDFGNIFNGTAYWLQIGVRPQGNVGDFVSLSPRQPFEMLPYAQYSATAGVAATATTALLANSANSVSSANISGIIPLSNLPTNVAIVNRAATFSALQLSILTNLSATAGSVAVFDEGQRLTNSQVTASDLSFLIGIGIINIKAAPYNAKGDGVADDTIAIQQALDDAAARGGGRVYIPAGTYNVTNILSIGSFTQVTGAGMGLTTLRGGADAYLSKPFNGMWHYVTLGMIAATNSSIRDLTVDHWTNKSKNNGLGILADGVGTPSEHCVIERCEVIGYTSHQYLIWNYKSNHSKVLFNQVRGMAVPNAASQQEGIEVYGGTDVLISGNTIIGVGQNGIYCSDDTYPDSTRSRIRITSNSVEGSFCGISVSFTGVLASDILVSGNQITSCPTGIKIIAATGSKVDGVQVLGNSVRGATDAIWLYGYPGLGARALSIKGNNLLNSGLNVAAMSLTYFQGADITDNIITGSDGEGVRFVSSGDCRFYGNRISSMGTHAINIQDSSSILISGNLFQDYNRQNQGSAGVLAAGPCTNVVVIGNSFNTTNESYAVWITGSASSQCEILGNFLQYASTFNPVFRNDGNSPNTAAFTPSAGVLSQTIPNLLVNGGSRLLLIQESGVALPFTVQQTYKSFTVSFATPSRGNETFRYEILH